MIAPRQNPILLGQDRAIAALHHAATGPRLHHAWLITGPPGIGKATVAYRFARWLLAGATTPDLSLDPDDPVFRRVAVGSHPDLMVVERRYSETTKRMQGEIVIDTVREAADFLHLTPADGGWRIVLVDGIETINRNAANGMLKLLEEPPPRAIWLLCCAAPGRLPATVHSRCRRLDCDKLSADTIDHLLTTDQPDLTPPQRHRLAALAEGSIGRALTLASASGIALASMADEALAAAVPPVRAAAIADTIARSEGGFSTFMDLLRTGLATATTDAARSNPTPMLAHRAALWQDFARIEAEVSLLNLDPRAAILTILHSLRPA